ncbi:KRAB-A domain-containing protein 2-like protein [Plakobranchus ocellatus]|uniref:KRAB-A domain-containing protein 2-like protein n=1 Tax=Plakobranchus ocellatus TaxID=259542 RepID=A0AAV3YHX7_9GAST|nr:KRAB-A domain-containing protein 2-like protein [Plakobranchus ocellatus]
MHGKPRHPKSQGSVERANGDIKDIPVAWMADNDSEDWSTASASQAERVVKRNRVNLRAGEQGDNVAMPVPPVDRGRGDLRI